MLRARKMHPIEMKLALPDICLASGRPVGYFLKRLSEPHLFGLILLEEVAHPEVVEGEAEDVADEASLRGFLLYRIDRLAGTVRLGESRVFPAAARGGMRAMVDFLMSDMRSLGITMPLSAVLPEDDPGLDGLRTLGFRAGGIRRGIFGARDGYVMLMKNSPGQGAPEVAGS